MLNDPIDKFSAWYEKAKHPSIDRDAVALATSTPTGKPSVRFILLKGFDSRGFIFYTNLASRKAQELAADPQAALCFYWQHIARQVRIEGDVVPVSAPEADEYFKSRMRESQIAAWSSRQSQPLSTLQELQNRVEAYTQKFAERPVPRPEFWSGFRIVPTSIEFWKAGEFRLHIREYYFKNATGTWERHFLYP